MMYNGTAFLADSNAPRVASSRVIPPASAFPVPVFDVPFRFLFDFIITFNARDFPDSVRFGIRCLTPKEFLILLKDLP
jgi:hypothetical protein